MALFQISEPGLSPEPHQRRLAVGIDLGTTNSLVATVRSGVATVLPDAQGRGLLPSVVRYLPEGRTEVGYAALMTLPSAGEPATRADVVEQVEIQAKYAGYVDRQKEEVEKARSQEDLPLPVDLDYAEVHGLSIEVRQKLAQQRPETLGQASRIQGVTPAAISLLLVHLKRRARARPAGSPA